MAESDSQIPSINIRDLIDIQILLANSDTPLAALDTKIEHQEIQKVIQEFSLAKRLRGRDFILRGSRLLVYQTTNEEVEDNQKLVKNDIPHLPIARIVKPRAIPYAIIPLPQYVQPLDSRVWPDKEPNVNFHGSFEVFSKLAEVLAKLYLLTNQMPNLSETGLSNFAIVQGMNDLVRIAPPYTLVDVSNPEKFLEDNFWQALNRLDPSRSHSLQMMSFFTVFGRTLAG